MVSSPSITVPALRSMSCFMRRQVGVLLESLITGQIAFPIVVPRPVVKTTTLDPLATIPGVASWS